MSNTTTITDVLLSAWRADPEIVPFATLTLIQALVWSVMFELAYKPVRLFFSRFAFFWRMGNHRTNTGQVRLN